MDESGNITKTVLDNSEVHVYGTTNPTVSIDKDSENRRKARKAEKSGQVLTDADSAGKYMVSFSLGSYLYLHMARASIRRAMTHRQFKWLSFCSINSYAHINTSKAVNN